MASPKGALWTIPILVSEMMHLTVSVELRDSQEYLIDGDPLSERFEADLAHRRSGTGWF